MSVKKSPACYNCLRLQWTSILRHYTRPLRQGSNVIESIKIGRLKFASHICRMDPSSLTFRIFNYKPIGTRTDSRPKLRWADCVEDDSKSFKSD
ncbi:hypothetical protein TNCV_2390301 [Trichonephila clavipes]|nr:hypothetical protein TNCV_2390301 [Trichonephila clavipes]